MRDSHSKIFAKTFNIFIRGRYLYQWYHYNHNAKRYENVIRESSIAKYRFCWCDKRCRQRKKSASREQIRLVENRPRLNRAEGDIGHLYFAYPSPRVFPRNEEIWSGFPCFDTSNALQVHGKRWRESGGCRTGMVYYRVVLKASTTSALSTFFSKWNESALFIL